MRIRLIVLLALLGVLVPAQLEAAPGGAPEPTVTAGALNGSITTFTNCDGNQIRQLNSGFLSIVRTGSTAAPLEVDVSYGGTLTPGSDYPAQPDPVTIPAGADRAILSFPASTAGTVTITVEAGSGYNPGNPASATATVEAISFETECPAREEQTIELGATPTPLDVYGRFGGALADTVVQVEGDVPPGLTFQADGSFSGSATEAGTFSFTASYCLAEFCALELPVTIVVVPADGPPPAPGPSAPPTATPASPIAGQSTFTG